jgi:hypothetical protein
MYKSQGGSDLPSNIIALCRICHEKAHKGILAQDYLQGLQSIKLASKKRGWQVIAPDDDDD